MESKNNNNALFYLLYCIIGLFSVCAIQSCGKGSNASAAGLNIEYEVANFSPDLGPVNLYVRFNPVNSTFIFNNTPAYFYVPYTDTPYQFRKAITVTGVSTGLTGSAANSGNTLFTRDDILKTGLKYSLFIVGSVSTNTLTQVFTVDTASTPALGRGKVRFVNLSPGTATALDVYANGTKIFNALPYTNVSQFIEIPVGNYDIQIDATGTTSVLKEITLLTVQDSRLYTIYAHGYTNRVDSATFDAGIITNK